MGGGGVGICHLGFGFSLHGSINNAARLGRMICGHNACCGWNKYILKFRRERESTPYTLSPFSLSFSLYPCLLPVQVAPWLY